MDSIKSMVKIWAIPLYEQVKSELMDHEICNAIAMVLRKNWGKCFHMDLIMLTIKEIYSIMEYCFNFKINTTKLAVCQNSEICPVVK